jgi:hypothetical protein
MYKKESTESLGGFSMVTQISFFFFLTMQKKIRFTCFEVSITTVYTVS